ncbi:MAG: metal-dependent transcriptional regulator, partial [Acidimicrobiaceae bacterium]
MPNPGEHHPAFEEYCECIFELREDNLDVIQARIADRLRVSRPSVSEMIKRLTEERLILVTDGHITLTDSGEELAQRVV